jgi:hypothetical protein
MEAAADFADKRSSERRRLGQALRVVDLQSNEIIGHLLNLSATGFMLVGKAAIDANTSTWLAIELPEAVEGRRRVNVEARCIWCQKSSFSDDHGAGYEIRQISEDDQRRLAIFYGGL